MSVKSLVFLSLVCSLLAGCASQNGLFSGTCSLRQQYRNTIAYWQSWASLRMKYQSGVKYLKIDNKSDNLQLVEWNNWLAKQTIAIPQLHVDSRLTSLANEFVGIYRERAKHGLNRDELTQME